MQNLKENLEEPTVNIKALNYDATIQQLNNDCLEHIFLFLPIIDRIKVERVCKRWQTVSHETWRDYKELNLSKECWAMGDCLEAWVIIIMKVLTRCGYYITWIQFSEFMESRSNSTIKIGPLLGTFCPNLHTVGLSDVSSLTLKSLAENCHNIVALKLEDCITDGLDEVLSELFSKNDKLSSLILKRCSFTGKCLLHLPAKSVESLTIIESSITCDALRRLKMLSKLSLVCCDNFDDNVMEIIGTISTLKEVFIDYLTERFITLKPILNLVNLKKVELFFYTFMDDEFLIALSKHCLELSDVHITECFNVTDAGIAAVTSLPKLERLVINSLKISGAAFCAMPNLKILHCVHCQSLSNKACYMILKTSINIEIMHLCYSGISNKTINAAIQATGKRLNNTKLKLYVAGCRNVKINKIRNTSPWLQLIHEQEDELHYCL